MTLSTSILSYPAELDDWRAAATDPLGIRIAFTREADAQSYRARLHKARVIMRERTKETHEPGAPDYNTSAYDGLRVTIHYEPPDQWWVYIKHMVGPSPPEKLSTLPKEAQQLPSYRPERVRLEPQMFLQGKVERRF